MIPLWLHFGVLGTPVENGVRGCDQDDGWHTNIFGRGEHERHLGLASSVK